MAKLTAHIEIRDSRGKQKGYTVAFVSASPNKNGKGEETANSKQVLDSTAAVWKNILSTINNACRASGVTWAAKKDDLVADRILDMTKSQIFLKSGYAVSGLKK
mgnify:CR=1 FL=1